MRGGAARGVATVARHLPAHVIGEALVASERARPPASTEASSRVEPERRRPRKPILQVRINGARAATKVKS